jgi:hypothetical protein
MIDTVAATRRRHVPQRIAAPLSNRLRRVRPVGLRPPQVIYMI